jgi:hypothetical protein
VQLSLLVAHLVSGYDEAIVEQAVSIPERYPALTLVNKGKHSDKIQLYLIEK